MRKQKKKGSEEREKHSIEEELEGSTQNLEKYQLLLLRNEQLATEIIKLRSKNRNLISELQEYRRKQFYRRYETKCTQTSLEVL